jgi:hypothetical protein
MTYSADVQQAPKSDKHQHTQTIHVPFALGYTFDYARFDKPDLQTKAKSTLGNL